MERTHKSKPSKGKRQSEQPTNNESKRTYPTGSDATDRKEEVEAKGSGGNVRDKRETSETVIEIL